MFLKKYPKVAGLTTGILFAAGTIGQLWWLSADEKNLVEAEQRAEERNLRKIRLEAETREAERQNRLDSLGRVLQLCKDRGYTNKQCVALVVAVLRVG